MTQVILARFMFSVAVFVILSVAAHAHAGVPVATQAQLEDADNSYLFVFHDDVGSVSQMADALARTHGGQVRFVYKKALKGFSATVSAQAAANIARNPRVKYYEKNGIAWALAPALEAAPIHRQAVVDREPAQQTPYGIARVGGPLDGSGKHAWVIDTGIDLDHPDLNVGTGANFVLRGKNSPNDGNGHGTHVAGTIAALNNAIDVVGVAAGAVVHPLRVLDNSGGGTIDAVVAGVDFVATHAVPGDAVNMSLGALGHFQSLHDAIINAANMGFLFAIAAGNDSDHAGFYEPAHIDHANVYTVSAIDANDVFAVFSNFGNPPVDFAAPGVAVLSTRKGGGVTTFSGTSMAAPHVAGLLLFLPVNTGGFALGDPDGIADPIAHH